MRPGIGGKGGRVDPEGPSPAGGLAPTVNPAIGGSGVMGVEEPAGGLAPIVRPAMGGKLDGASESAVAGDKGGLAPTVIPGMDEAGEVTEGDEVGFIPKVESRSSEAGLLVAETVEAGIAVGIESFTLGGTIDTAPVVGFFVEKVKMNFVPGSAFSATAFPP